MERSFALVARIGAFLADRFADIEAPDAPEDVEGCEIVANHTSLFDVFVGWAVLHRWQRPVRLLVRARYVDAPVLGAALRRAGAIPVRDPRSPGSGFARATEALAAGDSILVMPEGHLATPDERAADGLGRFHNGVGRLLVGADAPVLAAWIHGAERVWPQGRRRPRLTRRAHRPAVTVRYEVVRLDPAADLDADAVTATIRAELRHVAGRGPRPVGVVPVQPSPSMPSSCTTSSGAATIR